MRTVNGLGKRPSRVLLSALLLVVAGVCLRWVFLVPIYQAPDEPAHLDYALALHRHGGLFRISGPPKDRLALVHPYTHYLLDRSAEQTIPFHPEARMPPGYGLASFYAEVDAHRPSDDRFSPEEPPGLAWVYPFGYYALLACWIHLLTGLSSSLVFIFFGARLLSVVLLMGSLLCTYATARELRLGRGLSLLLTGIIGLFPLTLFVSSYVQPDNLSFTLVSLCSYLALAAHRNLRRPWFAGVLGLALGALLVTKVHYFVCMVIPVLGLLVTDFRRRDAGVLWVVSRGALVALPPVLFGSVYLWTTWDSQNYYQTMAAPGNGSPSMPLGFVKAIRDFYWGTSHKSFWGVFGWMDTPLVIHDETTTSIVRWVLRLGTWFILALTLARLMQVLAVLCRLLRRGKWQPAARSLASNAPLNSFFLFTALMVYFHVHLGNRFGAQGRNWVPFLLPIFLTAVRYAPKALRSVRHQRILSRAVLTILVSYGLVGNHYALRTIRERFYHPENAQPMCRKHVSPQAALCAERCEQEPGFSPCHVFSMDKPAYVYAIRIHYRVNHVPENPVTFRLFWVNTQAGADPTECRLTYELLPSPMEKTISAWVNDSVDRLGLSVEGEARHFEVREMVLFQKRESPSVPDGAPLQ
jgi:hypothetical protein